MQDTNNKKTQKLTLFPHYMVVTAYLAITSHRCYVGKRLRKVTDKQCN